MTKAKILNKTATMTLILLLLLSMVGIINIAFVSAHPGLILTPNSGKVKTTFTVAGTGFGDTKKVGIGFGAEATATDTLGTGDGVRTLFTGSLTKGPVKPYSLAISTIVAPNATYQAGKYDNDDPTSDEAPGAIFAGDITYSNIQYSDDVYEITSNVTKDAYVQHIFNFTLPTGITKSMVKAIIVKWEGYGTGAGDLMLYNFTERGWVKVGSVPTTETLVSISITADLGKYIDSLNHICFMAVIPSTATTNTLRTDTVWLVVEATVTAQDNGSGGITGNATGTINYATKAFSITFNYPVKSGTAITGTYISYAYDITPTPIPVTNSTGYFKATCEVPFVKTGTYTVTAINEVGYKDTGTFTVVRGITLIPSKGPAGGKVTVYGSGFTPSGTGIVDIYFDKNGNGIYEAGELWIADQTTDADGKFSTAATATPPVTAGYGYYRVYATDGVYSALAYYTVCAPEISISPDKGTAGTVISVSINYFNMSAGAGDVQVFFDANNNGVPDTGDIIILVYQTSLNASGGASGLSITVPEGVGYGAYGVIAKNAIGESASKTFTVMQPTISIVNPAGKKGVAGMSITIQVNYFNKTTGAGTTYVFFDANKNNKYDVGETRKDLTLNNTGGAEDTLVVPTVAYGTYPVNATNNIHSAVDYFSVEPPVIAISKYPVGVPGTPVEVDINYFSLGADVKIGYDVNKNGILEVGEVVTTVLSTALNATGGKAAVVVAAPAALGYGTYVINATNPSQWATTTFTVMQPVIKLSRDKGTAGTPLTVDINYFNRTSGAGDVRIGFDLNKNGVLNSGEVLASKAWDALNDTGGFSGILMNVPDGVSFGVYKVNATNNVQSVVAIFIVMEPVIAISPVKGTAGTVIDVWVNYYNKTTGAQPTYVFFDTNGNGKWDTGEPKVSPLTLNETGGATTTLTVPDGVGYGAFKVYGNNTRGQAVYATFKVMEPVMNIGPTSGATGTTVTVEINYFNKTAGAGTTYTFFDINKNGVWDLGEPMIEWTGTLGLNNTGGGKSTLTVPTVEPGVYNIYTKNKVQSIYRGFTVVSREISLLEEIKAMLNNTEYGLQAIKNAIDAISSKLGTFMGTDTVASLLYDIKGKLDNSTYGLIAIKDAITDVKAYLTDTIYFLVDEVEPLLKNSDYGLAAIKNAVDAIKAKIDTINWADIETIKADLGQVPKKDWWDLVHLINFRNMQQFHAGTYNTTAPTSTNPVNLGKSSKVTLTVRAIDDATAGFKVNVYIYDGTTWQPLSFNVLGSANADCAATVEFTTGTDGRFYFEITGATFTAFIYSAESAPYS